jgi:uncharacterized protein involved in outer membrane biogenesis
MPPTPAAGARGASLRRVLKWAGAICLALAVLLVVVVGALHTPAGRRLVLSRVTALLAARQIDFRADQLRFNLLDLSLDLRDVVVRSARSAQDPPFAVIGRLTADLSLIDLLRGKYVVESAVLDGARVHYLVDAGGDNLPRMPRDPNAPDQPADYLVASLTATGAHVEYDDRVRAISAVLPVRSLTMRGDRLTDRHAIAIDAAGGRLRAEGRDVRLDSLSAELDLGDDDVDIGRAVLVSEASRVEVSGKVDRFDDPILDTRVVAALDAARGAELAGIADRIAGQVTVEAKAAGPASAPVVDAHVEGRALAFRTLEGLSLDAHVGYDAAGRRVTAHQLDARAAWGHVAGSGVVSLAEGPSRASLRAAGLDLQTLMRGLALRQAVASRLDAEADLRWP